MANKGNEIVQLINQAISCEHPQIYGAVNLNLLREALHLLVAQGNSRVALEELELQEANRSSKTANHEVGESSSPIVENGEPNCEQQSSVVLNEILCKVEAINKRLEETEAKVEKLEQQSSGNDCLDGTASQQDTSESKIVGPYDVHRATLSSQCKEDDDTSKQSTEGKTSEISLNTNLSQTMEYLRESDVQLVSSQSAFPNKSTDRIDDDRNISHVNQDQKTLRTAENGKAIDKNKDLAEHENSCMDKINCLSNMVDGLLQHVERLNHLELNIDQTVLQCVRTVLQQQNDGRSVENPPQYGAETRSGHELQERISVTDQIPKTSSRIANPEDDKDSFHAFVIEIRTAIAEIRDELVLLAPKLGSNGNRIAAGVKSAVKTRETVRCISCDCSAAMKMHESRVPEPAKFTVKRPLKCVLQSELHYLQRDKKRTPNGRNMKHFEHLTKRKN